jgi:hypothetical protein
MKKGIFPFLAANWREQYKSSESDKLLSQKFPKPYVLISFVVSLRVLSPTYLRKQTNIPAALMLTLKTE